LPTIKPELRKSLQQWNSNQQSEIKHGKIRVGFTPDEEIGRGAHHFDVENSS
jgi:di/tripeptidase